MKLELLKPYSRPSNYIGATWGDYFVFLGRNRDSDALSRANFDAALKDIGGENSADDENETPLVLVVRENHWACGWIEWIAIHKSQTETLEKADTILQKLEDYPVVDEELWSNYEEEEAGQVWKNCYDASERLEYIREHRSQFEFHSFADLLGCVRGHYFAGYANELLN